MGSFANMLIYSDEVRYALPVPEADLKRPPKVVEPRLLNELSAVDSSLFKPVPYSTASLMLLTDENLKVCFGDFCRWAVPRKHSLRQWLDIQMAPWVQRDQQVPRVPNRTTYDVQRLENSPELRQLCADLNLGPSAVLYTFDLVVRYPLYGKMTGPGCYYLSHPIRDAFRVPAMKEACAKALPIPLSFEHSIKAIAHTLSIQDFVLLIATLRELTRDLGICRMHPGDCDKEVVRELAIKAKFAPHVKGRSFLAAAVAAVATGTLNNYHVLPSIATTIGVAVAIGVEAWNKATNLPRSAGNISWLRWAMKWEIEDQIESKDRRREA